MPAAAFAPSRTMLLENTDWTTYSRLLHVFRSRPGVRLTYDRGDLEIMTLSPEHEGDAYLLGSFVDALTEELGLPRKAGRSTTFRRRKKQRGLEPDNSYWIQNEAQVRGKRRIDLRVDPPPDLAIEVDVTHSSLDRMSIYAALGIAEVWRLADDALTFHALDASGGYRDIPRSVAFAFLSPADLLRFRALCAHTDETTVVREFRAWVRQQVAPPAP